MTAFDIPWRPAARTLRQFAVLWLLCVGLLAWRFGVAQGQAPGVVLAALAVGVGVIGWRWPAAVRPLFVALIVLTLPIGWAVSNLLLIVVFYGLFTPIALLFRLLGRDALERRFYPDRDTYWEPKVVTSDPARYFRPF
jgi:hypothetical protein